MTVLQMMRIISLLKKIELAIDKLEPGPERGLLAVRLKNDVQAAEGPPTVTVAVSASLDQASIAARLDETPQAMFALEVVALPDFQYDEAKWFAFRDTLDRSAAVAVVVRRDVEPPPMVAYIVELAVQERLPIITVQVGHPHGARDLISVWLDSYGAKAPVLAAVDLGRDHPDVANRVAGELSAFFASCQKDLPLLSEIRLAKTAKNRKEELVNLVATQKAARSQKEQDEAFWRRQELRRKGRLGQPGCSMSGLLTLALDPPGNFAVVVHSDRDCVTAVKVDPFKKVDPSRLFCTNLSDDEIITGKSSEKLEACLHAVARHRKPNFMLLLSGCPVVLANDPFEDIAREVEARTKVPITAVNTHGMGVFSQSMIVDLFAQTFLSLISRSNCSKTPEKRMNGVWFLGFPSRLFNGPRGAEVSDLLVGVKEHGLRPLAMDAPVEDWAALMHADAVLVSDRGVFTRTLAELEGSGVTVIEAPMPIGFLRSRAFYESLAAYLGAEAGQRILERTRELLKAEKTVLARFRHLAGTRIAYGVGMRVDFNPLSLAGSGLSEVFALIDYGFDVELMIQGVGNEEQLSVIEGRIRELGLDIPCHGISDIASMGDVVARRHIRLVVAAEHMGLAASSAGVPLLRLGQLRPGFTATEENLRLIERHIAEGRRS